MQNQLFINTCIFKENLKIIVSSLIESVWKDKIRSEKIKETIKSACNEIYRGKFEEIKELDEEEMYNSWMNSRINTEKGKSESKEDKEKGKEVDLRKGKSLSLLAEDDEVHSNMIISDIYDKANCDKRLKDCDRELHLGPREHQAIPKSTDVEVSGVSNLKSLNLKSRIKTTRSDSENLGRLGLSDIRDTPNVNKSRNSLNNKPQLKERKYLDVEDSSSDIEEAENQGDSPLLQFRGHPKSQMRSFDRTVNQSLKMNSKAANLVIDEPRYINPKHSSTIREIKRSNMCLKEQYYTNVQNNVKRDRKANTSKIDLIDQKLKHSIKQSTKECHFKLSLTKMHARNRSANSLKCRSYFDEGALLKTEHVKGDTEKRDFPVLKTEFCR